MNKAININDLKRAAEQYDPVLRKLPFAVLIDTMDQLQINLLEVADKDKIVLSHRKGGIARPYVVGGNNTVSEGEIGKVIERVLEPKECYTALKADKNFIRFYVTPRTFGGEAENQGEIDGKSFLQKGTFFYPGTREEAIAFARKINNARGILIGIDPNTGKRYQFGSREFPCHFKPKIDFGNEPTSRRGLTVEFEADNFMPTMIYPGSIPLSGAALPPQS